MKYLLCFSLCFYSFSQTLTIGHSFHRPWDQILKKYVVPKNSPKSFDYKELLKNPQDKKSFENYIKRIQAIAPSQLQSLSLKRKMAFWINSYNSLTVKLILDHYPVKSIKKIFKIALFFHQNPWKKNWFQMNADSKATNLDYIEHKILRPGRSIFNDSRIHFALNCASISCPSLLPMAFTEENSDDYFNKSMNLFFNDPSKNYYDPKTRKVKLSPIFNWFREDFGQIGTEGHFLTMAERYMKNLPQKARRRLKAGTQKVSFLKYNWLLNGL